MLPTACPAVDAPTVRGALGRHRQDTDRQQPVAMGVSKPVGRSTTAQGSSLRSRTGGLRLPFRRSSSPKPTPGRRARGSRKRRRAIAGGIAVALVASGFAWAVVTRPGNTTEHVDPNDGTVWVTNDRQGLFGRLNAPAASLDTAFPPVDGQAQTYQLDVYQSGGTVLARDRIASRVVPVDTLTGALVEDRAVVVPSGAVVAAGAGTVVVVDPANGQVRASSSTTPAIASVEGLAPTTDPVGSVDLSSDAAPGTAPVAATVGADGTAYVIGSGGTQLTVTPDGIGGVTAEESDLGARLRSVQAVATEAGVLVVDTVGLAAILPDGTEVALPDSVTDGVLQTQPGTPVAWLSTPRNLLRLDLATGAVTQVSTAGTGTPAAPVVTDDCVYAAWAGTPGRAVRACGSAEAAAVALEGSDTLLSPALRLNRRSAVLNDGSSGGVWDLNTGKRLDNWNAVAPQATTEAPEDPTDQTTLVQSDRPPTAVDDELFARPGVTSVLHPLDNDSNPSGNVLSIRAVTPPTPADSVVSISPDGQTVQVNLAPGTSVLTFGYTIDDGKGNASSAMVTVTARDPLDNRPPELREGFTPTLRTVANQGTLELPVIGDWRDPDSDPVLLASARDGEAPLTVTTDGRIRYVAPGEPGPRTLTYVVSDGALTTEGEIQIEVLDRTSTATSAPITQPDVGRGEVEQPIVIRPLENDLPGTDPSTPSAQLELAGEALAPEGATAETNVKDGTVTVTAKSPGTYLLSYAARYGDAPYGRGTIRVDVAAAEDTTGAPTAMLDQAVVHGQTPTIIDVLANDFDPSGRLLAVDRAVAESSEALEVAVIRGRWLRVRAIRPELVPNPMRIQYSITNGAGGTATGEVALQQLPPPVDRTPVTAPDHATVRSGDLVAIPVLDNDTDPAGEILRVLTQGDGTTPAGTLPVRGPADDPEGNGAAYVTSSLLRFQAPDVTTVTEVSVDYVVENASGQRAGGTAYVTIIPPPAADRPNLPPAPPTLEGRVVAGATTTIQIPSSSVDPDGDSVAFLGLASAPEKGRIMDQTPSSIAYQAYPISGGTDEFTYVVTDRFGAQGTGTIRIAVVPPGDPQPVVAVDDVVVVAPGRTVSVDVVANDIVPIGDTAQVPDLARLNPDLGDVARLDADTNSVRVAAPPVTEPLELRYGVVGASGAESVGTVRVRSQEGVNLPPVARNAVAQPEEGATNVQADVLVGAYDPDDEDARLTVTRVYGGTGVVIDGSRVTFDVTDLPQVLAYEIEDEDGGVGIASIFVPSGLGGAPSIRHNSLITMQQDSTTTVALKDFVVVPSGRPAILTTTDRLFASPIGMLKVEASGRDELVLTSMGGYNGPAAITVEVTDGTGPTDPDGKRALLTIPVQVGPETPVLRCPPAELDVVLGGESRPLDVAALCHVWVSKPGQLQDLQFTGTLVEAGPGLTVTNRDNHTLAVAASNAAIPGSRARLQIGIAGSPAQPAFVTVRVAAANPPTVNPITLGGVKAGATKSLNIAGYVTSQLGSPQISIVALDKLGGSEATVTRDGPTTIAITPDRAAKGQISYAISVTDVGDTRREDRIGRGTLVVEVLGVPDAPGRPVQVGPTLSRQVLLGWGVPADNGLPIESYEVSWPGGEQRCAASPCLITGLDNGRGIPFTVRAINGVGPSQPSPASDPLMPDSVPQAPAAGTTEVSGPSELRVAWEAAAVDGSPVQKYLVTWPGGSQEVQGLTTTVGGLDNSAVTPFTIKAMNAAGWGPGVQVNGQSAGPPAAPRGVTTGTTDDLGSDQSIVRVSWEPVAPNGPAPTTYTVVRSGGSGTVTLCDRTTETTCLAGPVDLDGTVYSYAVTASNAHFSSPASDPVSRPAVAPPGEFRRASASATGVSRQVRLQFTTPSARDAQLTVTCVVGGMACGQWVAPRQPTSYDELITVPANGENAVVTLTASNSVGSRDVQITSDTVYGPISDSAITAVSTGGPYVRFTAQTNPQGLPASVRIRVRDAGGGVRETIEETTAGSPWSKSYSFKLDYERGYTITMEVSRNSDVQTVSADVSTSAGNVTVTATPIPETTTSKVRVRTDNLPPSATLRCTISRANQSVAFTFPSNASGVGTYDVPEADFVAESGRTYQVSCDDTQQPNRPVQISWQAP